MGKQSVGKIPRFVAFTTLTYPENPDWDSVFLLCDALGYPYAYCIHDRDLKGDLDKPEEWKPDKVHCQSIIRVPNAKTVSAFSAKMGIDARWVQGLSSYKEFCCYINHSDADSIRDPRKVCYPTDRIKGSLAQAVVSEIENHTGRNMARSKEDDINILEIIKFIEQWDYLPMSTLVRWACETGYYSTLRRASSIVRDILREHNNAAQHTVAESLLQIKVNLLEERVTKQEKELERAYGDLWDRVKNPFNGNAFDDARFSSSVSEMMRQIDECKNSA